MSSAGGPPTFRLRGHPELIDELQRGSQELNIPVHLAARLRDGGGFAELIVALGSAGVFTALYELISRTLARSKDRELTVERDGKGGVSITLKGHAVAEERELVRQLAPELLPKDHPPADAASS